MSIKQILLSLPTYPDAPPLQTLESAVQLAQLLEAKITAQIPQLSSDQTTWPAIIGTFPLDFPKLMDEAVVASERNAADLTAALTRLSAEFRNPLDLRRNLTTIYASPESLVDLARLHDLLILPVPEIDSFGRNYMEAAIFDTGRPTLLLPSGEGCNPLRTLDLIVVAWDYSREAARALGDALPLLIRAKRVHILSIFGEKGIHTSCGSADLEKYLTAHRVKFVVADRTLTDGSVSELLASYAAETGADMLVMGAYGHSRFREFVLGGATRGMLSDPPLPVFLSH